MDIQRIAEIIGVPVGQWAGDCDGISHAIVRTDALRKVGFGGPNTHYRVARGHWLGGAQPGSYFYDRALLPFIPHSWIQVYGLAMPRQIDPPLRIDQEIDPSSALVGITKDPIVDPTRFAFDGETPYIYVGENDHYDEGGNAWREVNRVKLPVFDASKPTIKLKLPLTAQQYVERLMDEEDHGPSYPYGVHTYASLMWLANLPVAALGPHALSIYGAIVDAGHGAAIPLDNRRMVLGC